MVQPQLRLPQQHHLLRRRRCTIQSLRLIRRSRSAKKWTTKLSGDGDRGWRAGRSARPFFLNEHTVEAKPTTHQTDLSKLPRALAPLMARPQWAVWRWTQQ